MSPGSVRLAGNIPDGEGLIYYVVCSSHGEVEERRSLGVSCPMGHVPKQVKVRLRCPTCRWVDPESNWHSHKPKCRDGYHELVVLEYSPI